MTDAATPRPDLDDEPTLSVDVPHDAELWVGVEQREGYAPTVIIGGSPTGLRVLADLARALADTGVHGGQVSLKAGDLLLEGSEADLVLAIQTTAPLSPPAPPGPPDSPA